MLTQGILENPPLLAAAASALALAAAGATGWSQAGIRAVVSDTALLKGVVSRSYVHCCVVIPSSLA